MTPMQTIVLVFAAALLAVAGLAVTVHYRGDASASAASAASR